MSANRVAACLGFLVETRNEITGATHTAKVALSRNQVFQHLMESTLFDFDSDFDEDDHVDPEPGEVEAVAHLGHDRLVLRFWSPDVDAAEAVAEAIRGWEVQP
jgi:hypothetical protein